MKGYIPLIALGSLAVGTMLGAWVNSAPRHAIAAQHDGAKRSDYAPLDAIHLHLCAFHVAKSDPGFQVVAHHYCSPVGEGVHQCVITDSNGPGARILGIEYIVTEAIYQGFPDSEKMLWHPHPYEVLSGQLVAPGMPQAEEDALMKKLIHTWGKTWHTWPDPAAKLPVGEPLLMWSIGKDGELAADLLDRRDRSLGISTAAVRDHRATFGYPVPHVSPPASLDALGRRWTDSGPDTPEALRASR